MGIKAGIIGNGVVGGSLTRWFQEYTDHTIRIYDPGQDKDDDLSQCDIYFIAVPVPTVDRIQDLSLIRESILRCTNKFAPIMIRSSVLPDVCDFLSETHDRHVYGCPEFLTERRAYEDMKKNPIVIGYPEIKEQYFGLRKEGWFAQKIFPGKKLIFTAAKEAFLGKFTHNCFGAFKVNFFNVIKNIADEHGADYEKVKEVMDLTGLFAKEHREVPGHDNRFGYGGKCYLPNMSAMAGHKEAEEFKPFFEMIIAMNEKFRND